MQHFVIPSKLEQEYLLRVFESAPHVRSLQQFFLWTQGQLQALLPHDVMLCMQFDGEGGLLRLECLHSCVLDDTALRRLCDRREGLAVRLGKHCRAGVELPAVSGPDGALASFQGELDTLGYGNALVHGSGQLTGGSTLFALLRMPGKASTRHAYFFDLLLPCLHMALLRLPAGPDALARQLLSSIERPVSAREAEILHWVREGKSNYEIGRILGISDLTVKNHLQRVYKNLGVSNRTQAVSRCQALRVLERL
ncbi:MAG: XrtB/PEP-CTERM-associated transcriptional regulator EpsA [Pseudomonadota bacterium]